MDDYDNSLKLVDRGLEVAPNALLYGQKTQLKIKTHEGEELLEFIEELLQKYPNHATLLRLKYLSYVTHWQCCVKEFNTPLETINSLIAGDPNNQELLILKSLYYCMVNKYREAKRFLIKEVELNILKKDPIIHTSLYFILTFTYIARGKFEKSLDIANQMIDLYPNHPISHLTKALVLGYNLIYKFRFQEPDVDNFLDLIKKSVELDQHKYNITRYLQFQGYVLHGTGRYDEAIESIDTAIKILPTQKLLYGLKTYFLISSNKDSEALQLIDEYIANYPQLDNSLYKQKTFLYCKLEEFEKGLNTVNIALDKYPKDVALVNNKTILLGYLGRKKETIETANYLISLNPSYGNSYDTYGEVLMKFGEYNKALQKLEEALTIEPTGWFAYETCMKICKCHKELGNFEKALEYAEKAKALSDKMLPSERENSQTKLDEFLTEIRKLMEKSSEDGEST
jgi:tetratricopeptide (TPR) repeat protein